MTEREHMTHYDDETYSAEQINDRLGTTADDWDSFPGDETRQDQYVIAKPDGGSILVKEVARNRFVVLRGWGM